MQKEVYAADFATIKNAYCEVKTFLEGEVWNDEKVKLETTIEGDLGLAGDDNLEMLEKFAAKYGLELESFDYCKHFLSEGELFNSTAFDLRLLLLPVWLIEKLSFGKLNIYPHSLFERFYRPTTDLTFRGMVEWYLTKTYIPSENLSIKLAI
jgi:hypothetical protein